MGRRFGRHCSEYGHYKCGHKWTRRHRPGCGAAAGNDNGNNVSWPASLSNVISVGALNLCDQRKNPLDGICGDGINWGSNYGTALDVMAAGVYLTTTDIMGEYGYSYTADPNYDPAYGLDYTGYMNGTSGATPIVSGVVGLMLSVNTNMTPAHVQEILQKPQTISALQAGTKKPATGASMLSMR
ncbi:MAG: S8 family serine peptidase [Anaerolineales bacterium]|nr:S8 family serine peptidase [Anaerolineales bacterium]